MHGHRNTAWCSRVFKLHPPASPAEPSWDSQGRDSHQCKSTCGQRANVSCEYSECRMHASNQNVSFTGAAPSSGPSAEPGGSSLCPGKPSCGRKSRDTKLYIKMLWMAQTGMGTLVPAEEEEIKQPEPELSRVTHCGAVGSPWQPRWPRICWFSSSCCEYLGVCVCVCVLVRFILLNNNYETFYRETQR